MRQIIRRLLNIELPPRKSAFLWGPRRVGKTYWIKKIFLKPKHHFIDLLKTDVFFEYVNKPSLLMQRWKGSECTVIDEIQKVPDLLNEIHWLIENKQASFILTGSSARSLRKKHTNLLAGRAWGFEMGSLSFFETKGFSLERVLHTGLLPSHFLSSNPLQDLRSYTSHYLKKEIISEALVRNIPIFSRFLQVSALTNAEILNYTNIARDTGVSAKVIRNYFDILEDTFLAGRLPAWRLKKKRKP